MNGPPMNDGAMSGSAGLPGHDHEFVHPDERELKKLIKHWRSGRATRNLWEAFSDAYIAVIGALMIGAMLVNVILQAQRVVAACDTTSCLSARTLLPWAAFAVAVAGALGVSRLFGPVLASAAEGFWLLEAPLRRSRILASRLVAALCLAAVGGAAIGAVVAALTGSGALQTGAWAAAAGLSAAGATAFAAAQQGVERTGLVRFAGWLFSAVGIAAMLLVIGIAAGWLSFGISADRTIELALAIAVSGALVLISAGALAALRLNRIRRARLLNGGALVTGLSGAFFALDLGLARDIVVERRAIEIGHVTPRRGKGVGSTALVWREWQRLLRSPLPLLVVAVTIVVPYAADALGMSAITPVFGALALFGALIPMLGGLRVLTRTGGLARCLPLSTGQIKKAAVVVPSLVATFWAIAVTAAFLGFGEAAVRRDPLTAVGMAVATAAAGLLAAVRWTQAKPVDFGTPMVSTPTGAFPPGLMTNLFRGFDICLLVTAPMLLGFAPIWSLLLAAIAGFILLGSFNSEEIKAKQAEQQRALEQQKRQRAHQDQVSNQQKKR